MDPRIGRLDAEQRAREKERSRAADERALASGAKSVAQLKVENEAFAPLASMSRLDLSASRSLS